MTEGYFYMEGMENLADVDKSKSKINGKKSRNYNGNGDTVDVKSKKSQEIRLHEIEQQLQMAESRCNKLKGQVDYMKLLYNQASPEAGDAPRSVGKPVHHKSRITTDSVPAKRKTTDRDVLPEMKAKGVKYRTRNDTAWKDVPEKDNAASVQSQQPSTSATAATSAATVVVAAAAGDSASVAAQSINNIISGITSSVHRLTQLHVNIDPSATSVTPSKHDALPIGIQNIKCIPRDPAQTTAAEKPYQTDPKHSLSEQQSSIIAIQRATQRYTRSKLRSRPKIVSSKLNALLNTRPPTSSTSINGARKKLKSAIASKSGENKAKTPPAAKGSGDGDRPLSLVKCKRKVIGKLRAQSSRTLFVKKPYSRANKTAGIIDKRLAKNEKLIELYHNSAAKIITESEDNIPDQKKPQKTGQSQANRVSRGNQSIIPSAPPPPPPPAAGEGNYGAQEDETVEVYKAPLSPIDENERRRDGLSSCKSYYLPTIASKMKQVAANYFENFNFRTIPFIAAKSTSPSHNLGVNIQQVLSIIKGRKPMEGISPTLAYNIELAATKLGSRPLSALVSNLGSRMARTACPLNRRYHYGQLQDMARDIPEETLEDLAQLREEDEEDGVNKEDGQHEHDWHVDAKSRSERCTCVPRQGVKFNEVYSRYVPEEQPPGLRQYTPPAARRIRKPWNPGGKYRDQMQRSNLPKARDIEKRERSLKEVLKNLHDEFAQLNERYDELKLEVNNGNGNQEVIHELEKLEKELQNKEDEIAMVMSLYKEVMTLKQQVRVLKKRASQSTVVVSPLHRHTRDYGERHAAGHLTTLLRHIQQFQGSLKNKPSNM